MLTISLAGMLCYGTFPPSTMISRKRTMLRVSVPALFFVLALTWTMLARAATGDTVSSDSSSSSEASSSASSVFSGIGTITIEQKNSTDSNQIGKWTLLKPANEQQASTNPTTTIASSKAGIYTIILSLPHGASSTIRVYRGDVLLALVERPQATFTLGNGENIRVVVHYVLTRVGTVAADSDPTGMTFRIEGPNGVVLKGETPTSFENTPEGQYKIIYDALAGCNAPTPKSLRLEAEGRINFSVKVVCEEANRMRDERSQQNASDDTHITVTNGNGSVTFEDVPKDAWFATYVFTAAKADILTGYHDEKGNPTGQFGPGNNVTVAELAKIAHKISGKSEEAFASAVPENPHARHEWFSPFLASAEQRGWTIFADATIDPVRPATRGEVLVTLLQALDVPLQWQKGTIFTDVTPRTAYAGAIETAAQDEIVEKNATFLPGSAINRAEMAKIITKALEVYRDVK